MNCQVFQQLHVGYSCQDVCVYVVKQKALLIMQGENNVWFHYYIIMHHINFYDTAVSRLYSSITKNMYQYVAKNQNFVI